MEISLGDYGSISCSTFVTNDKLCVAVVSCSSTALTRNEHIAYSQLKQAALEAIAQQLHVWPLVVERPIPELWSVSPQRRQQAAMAARTSTGELP